MAAGAALIAMLAQMRIPLWFTPVPITGQTLGVLLAATALGRRRGFGAALLYLTAGGLGLPVFAGLGAGPSHLAGPTGGYLLAFAPAAWLCGRLAERGWDRRFGTTVLALLAGTATIYLFGAGWLGLQIGFGRAIALGVLPFIPGDLIKLALAASLLPLVRRLI